MKTIEVQASRTYPVLIGSGLLKDLGKQVKYHCSGEKAVIVSDSNVFPIYGHAAAEYLAAAGFRVVSYIIQAGEESKNGTEYLQLVDFLAETEVTRSDCLIALGGGVVGDLTGFAAATYLRGIDFVQVPTTLLAAVDSSVGGKTAIDLPAGKNLCGAFYQPKLVLCDIDTLNTLPQDVFLDGCAEVIKYGILYDPALFSHLQEKGIAFDREAVIARCVELKRDVVMCDEFDTGERMKLNLGHTIGHGVEAQSEFAISHGKAVAIGMAIVARAASQRHICPKDIAASIVSTIQSFGLPVCTDFTAAQLYQSAVSDKKRSGSTLRMIVPVNIGDCRILPMNMDDVETFIEEGL